MNKNFTYLFYGFNGEYVLNPVYKEMIKRGYTCLEIDTAYELDQKGKLDTLKGKQVVLVTCAHVFFDKLNINNIYPDYPDSISVLEVMDYLKPVRSIYYPHDLMDGFTHVDKDYFSLFDCYLSPLPVNAHGNRFCPVINVGWIKKNKIMSKRENGGGNLQINHGVGYFQYYKNNLDNMYNVFHDLWNLGVSLKLPHGLLNRHNIESYFSSKNIKLYRDDANIYDLIDDSDIVITNADTAVTIEASLSGRKVINIFDENANIPYEYQANLLQGLPNVDIMTCQKAVAYIKDLLLNNTIITSHEDLMKPFDMEKVINIIVGR